jgi:lipase
MENSVQTSRYPGRAAAGAKSDSCETLVLLHGSGSSSAIWAPVSQRLSDTYDVIAPDLIGHGAAAPWHGRSSFSLDEEARNVNDLVPCCERPFHVVGHSYGGAVALLLAINNPARVKTLTLIEPAFVAALRYAGDDHPFGELCRMGTRFASALESGNLEIAMRDYIDFWLDAGWWSGLPAHIQDAMVAMAGTIQLDWKALLEFDPGASVLLPLGAKTLIVRGDRSPLSMIRLVDALHRLMPGSTRTIVQRANHLLPVTHASEVTGALTAHLHAVGSNTSTDRVLR